MNMNNGDESPFTLEYADGFYISLHYKDREEGVIEFSDPQDDAFAMFVVDALNELARQLNLEEQFDLTRYFGNEEIAKVKPPAKKTKTKMRKKREHSR